MNIPDKMPLGFPHIHLGDELGSDSIIASCNCLTKTNEVSFHKPGCKYRLICERDDARAKLAAAESQLKWVNEPPSVYETIEVLSNRNRLMILDLIDDDEAIEKLCAPFLTEHELHGDSFRVPSRVDHVETAIKKLIQEKIKAQGDLLDIRDRCNEMLKKTDAERDTAIERAKQLTEALEKILELTKQPYNYTNRIQTAANQALKLNLPT